MVLDSLEGSTDDWVYKFIEQMERDGVDTSDVYSTESYGYLERLVETIREEMGTVLEQIQTDLEIEGLGQ